MTLELIEKLLIKHNESPVLLEGCVLNIRNNRSVIYSLCGETDYKQRELEICYADNHSDVIYKGTVHTEQELIKIILERLNT